MLLKRGVDKTVSQRSEEPELFARPVSTFSTQSAAMRQRSTDNDILAGTTGATLVEPVRQRLAPTMEIV